MKDWKPLSPAPLSTCLARRVCIIKPSSLGDVVQALPVLEAVRARFPKAHIAWVVNSSYAPLLRPVRHLQQVLEFDREKLRGLGWSAWRRFRAFLAELRGQRFDLSIDLQGLLRTGLMTWATGAPVRVGLASAREGANLFYTDIAQDLPLDQGAVERYWQVARLLGVGDWPKRFPLDLSAEELQHADALLADLPIPRLALNPAARWETKRWPAERFADAANRVVTDAGSVVLLGGPGEEAISQATASRLTLPHRNLCGRLTLRQLAAVLTQCDVLLTNDTGPMHLAAAVGTPTVSLFTCTCPSRASAYGTGHQILQTSVACKASYLRKCSRMVCMQDLTTDKLVPLLHHSLQNSQVRTQDNGGIRAA